ncbi:energy-coupling factor ABC transporter ATP-binding protein [Leifsonia sp. AG29]|uniref:energy-coupling factor ABC transporter ATP-binding protein n=1 Tax=Leifsonia sp. AG29 TaxID=2598860 RepID=UPI00131CE595|nr:energy-coupling factor ABC transporter ATP-binding protein [Leifsonia sp. AG29]
MSALHLRGARVRLDEVTALNDVTVDLDARRIAVIGENGSGKSTFARLLGGLVAASGGEVSVLGLDPARQASELRRRVAFVFSNPDAQIIMPTVAEDVAFSLRAEKLSREAAGARVADALARFGLSALADRPSHSLSGGQKQLLALCGAFIRNPELVIADEPTAYLDARNARRVAGHLFDGEHRLVLVTHDLELAKRCDTAVLFAGGTISAVGDPSEIVEGYEALLDEGGVPC